MPTQGSHEVTYLMH